ncbi:MAG TPA: hypothetical protein PKC24_07680 [Cyclobacteriaceae bacterium]|nr:hypothetical protein [Cyclobacteriaceae bacterium]
MRTIRVSISDFDSDKFGIKRDDISFDEFVALISKELSRQTLNNCIELADKYGLAKMSMEDISKEVKAVRDDAKNRA